MNWHTLTDLAENMMPPTANSGGGIRKQLNADSSDEWFAWEENSIRFRIKFNSIFPTTLLHDTIPLYKCLKLSKFKHTIKH